MELLEYKITVGNKSDIAAIVQFQVDMALESEDTVLDSDKVLRGVTAAMNDSEKGTYLVARNEFF